MTEYKIELTLCDVGHCGFSETYECLKKFWGTEIPAPRMEIIPPCHEKYFHLGYDLEGPKINVGLLYLNQLFQSFKQLGWKESIPINFLKYYFAREDTIYIAHVSNPNNFKRLWKLLQSCEKRNYKGVINACSIKAQLTGIGNIGGRHVAKRFDFHNEDFEKRLIEDTFERVSVPIEELQKTAIPVPKTKEEIKVIMLKFAGLMANSMCAVGLHLSHKMEEDWKDNYDKLVKNDLEPERYATTIEKLIKEKLSPAQQIIENYLR